MHMRLTDAVGKGSIEYLTIEEQGDKRCPAIRLEQKYLSQQWGNRRSWPLRVQAQGVQAGLQARLHLEVVSRVQTVSLERTHTEEAVKNSVFDVHPLIGGDKTILRSLE